MRKIGRIVLIAILLLIMLASVLFLNRQNGEKAVIKRDGELFSINGYTYDYCSGLKNYTISNKLIGKTENGMKIYMIEEYPDYEYVAGYYLWDGEIYKKVQ